jgi:hypothetical protein
VLGRVQSPLVDTAKIQSYKSGTEIYYKINYFLLDNGGDVIYTRGSI